MSTVDIRGEQSKTLTSLPSYKPFVKRNTNMLSNENNCSFYRRSTGTWAPEYCVRYITTAFIACVSVFSIKKNGVNKEFVLFAIPTIGFIWKLAKACSIFEV